MKRSIVFIVGAIISLAGCTPAIDAELALIGQSRKGVAMVRESIDSRQSLLASAIANDRRELEAAFDLDLAQRESIDAAWVREARLAYSAALDALSRRHAASRAAQEADLDNLAAIDEALAELERLNRAQRAVWSGSPARD